MKKIVFDKARAFGEFKPFNATNGGPWHKRHVADQPLSNFEAYKAAHIPYSRNHDSALFTIYGGPYSHDITAIFPRFEADVDSPQSYDFACTDEALMVALDAGTKTFFRLGQTIEHQIKKHGTIPPKDFKKWAQISEHIIRHYNEGWADGYTLDFDYYEIWNEPDLYYSRTDVKSPTWGGTEAEFYDFFETAAKHLKACFPTIKIGGPAAAGDLEWMERFIREMSKRGVALDFFSWHIYSAYPEEIMKTATDVRRMLDENGYTQTESILNEWNYIRGWDKVNYLYSLSAMHGLKCSSFILSTFALCHPERLDMMMYYDTRPSVFCGIFDFYTAKPLKAYYPMAWLGDMRERGLTVLESPKAEDGIYTLAGIDSEGKVTCLVTHYSEDDDTSPREIELDFGTNSTWSVYLLDLDHDGEQVCVTDDLRFTLGVHSSLKLVEN